MEVFRICKAVYATALTTSGSANRWNIRGQQIIYAGSSRSLASLELVAHRASIVGSSSYKVMVISLPDEDKFFRQILIKDLPPNWRTLAAYATLQQIGSSWYSRQETLALKVPSALIPYEYNYVLNTEHPAFKKNVQLVRTEDFFWDERLL